MHAWLVHAIKLAAVCTKPPMTRHADLSDLEKPAVYS